MEPEQAAVQLDSRAHKGSAGSGEADGKHRVAAAEEADPYLVEEVGSCKAPGDQGNDAAAVEDKHCVAVQATDQGEGRAPALLGHAELEQGDTGPDEVARIQMEAQSMGHFHLLWEVAAAASAAVRSSFLGLDLPAVDMGVLNLLFAPWSEVVALT